MKSKLTVREMLTLMGLRSPAPVASRLAHMLAKGLIRMDVLLVNTLGAKKKTTTENGDAATAI